jgi:hypothetical protein
LQFAYSFVYLLIEGDIENYNKLIGNRPNAININAALCDQRKTLHYVSHGGPAIRGFYEFMTPEFLRIHHPDLHYNLTSIDELPVVQGVPMKGLLSLLGVTHIDIWILDVEGAEESVLQGTDFNAITVNAICMECDNSDTAKNERKMNYLREKGYDCEHVNQRNCMCKRKAFKEERLLLLL